MVKFRQPFTDSGRKTDPSSPTSPEDHRNFESGLGRCGRGRVRWDEVGCLGSGRGLSTLPPLWNVVRI